MRINMGKIKDVLGLNPRPTEIVKKDEVIKIAIGVQGNKIILDLGKPLSSISMDKMQAISVAQAILQNIGNLKGADGR